MWEKIKGALQQINNLFYVFALSVFCSLLGIITASLLFPKDAGLFAVFFTSLALLPIIDKAISFETIMLGRRRIVKGKEIYLTEISFSNKLNPVRLLKDYNEIFSIYIVIFLAVFLVFVTYSALTPQAAKGIFDSLLSLTAGGAIFGFEFFSGILFHNLMILIIAFLFSLIYRSGAVFIVGLNAAVWGVVFVNYAAANAPLASYNPSIYLLCVLAIVIWHVILEGGGYVSAAISGSIISKAFYREKFFSERLSSLIRDGLIILIFSVILILVAAVVETFAIQLVGICGSVV